MNLSPFLRISNGHPNSCVWGKYYFREGFDNKFHWYRWEKKDIMKIVDASVFSERSFRVSIWTYFFYKIFFENYRFVDIFKTKPTKRNENFDYFLYSIISKAAGRVPADVTYLNHFVHIFQKILLPGTAFWRTPFLQNTFYGMLLTFGCCFHIDKVECLKKRAFIVSQKDICGGVLQKRTSEKMIW